MAEDALDAACGSLNAAWCDVSAAARKVLHLHDELEPVARREREARAARAKEEIDAECRREEEE